MRIVFIGSVLFSASALDVVCDCPEAQVVGIVTREASSFNSDFFSLQKTAAERAIPCFVARGNDQIAMADFIRSLHADVVYCFGWSYLLKAEVLGLSRLGVIGYHPSALPQNRGRHPLIWALALGLEKTASTFFFMDEGADSGDILHQRAITIEVADDAGTLYEKITSVAAEQIREFTAQLASGNYVRRPQDHTLANVWRKRDAKDGLIDWRMGARQIHNLVRALTRPYVGAGFVRSGEEVKIWKSAVAHVDGVSHWEPGRVLGVSGTEVTVKTGDGALTLIEHGMRALPVLGECL